MGLNKRLISSEAAAAVPTNTDNFDVVTYAGNNSTQSISSLDFQPDFVWAKSRTLTTAHNVFDSARGTTQYISTNLTSAQATVSNTLQSFDSDGFTVGSNPGLNWSSNTYVAWCWKAGGSAVSNTNGSITSSVSANPDAGFSIVSYTTQSSGTATVGHGLNAEPNIVLVKTTGVADSWRMYHSSLGAGYQIFLNLTNAAGVTANQWNNTAPTSSVFSLGTDNAGSYTSIAYCFHSVDSYQKVGSYEGSTSAVTVHTDSNGDGTGTGAFQPRFVLVKNVDAVVSNWTLWDSIRSGTNFLQPNNSGAEASGRTLTFNSDGFTINTDAGANGNSNGDTFIYLAIA